MHRTANQSIQTRSAAPPAFDHFTLASPIGWLDIHIENESVSGIDFSSHRLGYRKPSSAWGRRVAEAISQYFDGEHLDFDLPLSLQGTPHQLRVWSELAKIQAGSTLTYGELAKKIASSPRAVGNACRKNPVPLLIPCHRVVSASGIGGFAGATQGPKIAIKNWLLRHEGAVIKGAPRKKKTLT